MRYHYTECGLDYVWLENGYIYDKAEIIRGINLVLVQKPSILNAKEISYIRHTLDKSVKKLSQILKVNAESIDAWEDGVSKISPESDHMLKEYLLHHIESPVNVKVVDYVSTPNNYEIDEILFTHQEDNIWQLHVSGHIKTHEDSY